MSLIVIEMKCLHCGEEDGSCFDIKFVDENGFPDGEDWELTSGTQCNTCFERVGWRRLPNVETYLMELASDKQPKLVCSHREACENNICIHKVPHKGSHVTCGNSYCRVLETHVTCDKVETKEDKSDDPADILP